MRSLLIISCSVLSCFGRELDISGGVGQVEDVDKNEVKEIVWHAIPALNEENNGNWIVPFKILRATRQVVAGFLYQIRVLTAETKCGQNVKEDEINATNCPIKTDGRLEKWDISYMEQEWLNIHNYTATKVGDVTWNDVNRYKKR